MAIYNGAAAKHNKLCADKFEELKKHINKIDKKGVLNEIHLAHEHILNMEEKLKRQEKQIERYQNFFLTMQQLMPKQFSYHDQIG